MNCTLLPTWILCALALGLNTMAIPAAMAKEATSLAEATAAKTAQPIPWSQVGAKAGADYKGDGLSFVPRAKRYHALAEAVRMACRGNDSALMALAAEFKAIHPAAIRAMLPAALEEDFDWSERKTNRRRRLHYLPAVANLYALDELMRKQQGVAQLLGNGSDAPASPAEQPTEVEARRNAEDTAADLE